MERASRNRTKYKAIISHHYSTSAPFGLKYESSCSSTNLTILDNSTLKKNDDKISLNKTLKKKNNV